MRLSLLQVKSMGLLFLELLLYWVPTPSARAAPAVIEAALREPQLATCELLFALDTSKKNMAPRLWVNERVNGSGKAKVSGPLHAGTAAASDQDFNGKIDRLSDRPESNETPSGNFEITNVSTSPNNPGLGLTIRLVGLEPGNRATFARGVIMHFGKFKNDVLAAARKAFKPGTAAYIAAMREAARSTAFSHCTYTHGCVSIANDQPYPGKRSEWDFALRKAQEYKNAKKRVCLHIPRVAPDQSGVLVTLPSAAKRTGQKSTLCTNGASKGSK